jgi:hypothetical protein
VAGAEKALEDGQTAPPISVVVSTFPKIRATSPGKNPVETRALRVFALAIVRSDGKVNERPFVAGAATWTPAANLEWAVETLREIDHIRPNDPAVQADLGEALSKLPHGRAKAFELLSGLAKKDLMGSPHAYAALAKLESDKGDAKNAEAALKKCREMTKSPRVCGAASAKA